jgi:selenocysteine lyase/cysteine desulfurase
MAGCTASIDYIADLVKSAGSRRQRIVYSMSQAEEYESELFAYMESEIKALPGITLYGHAKKRTPTLYFNIKGVAGADVYQHLAGLKINAPAHNFYALEASRALGLGDTGAVRAGLAPYSSTEDVDRLVAGLRQLTK